MNRRSIMSTLAAACGLAGQDKPAAKKITADEVRDMLKEDIFFLDVREPKELEETGTVKGYVNIPLGQLEARLKEIPKDKRILVA
jgi:rhodanese-related sulfurtransferase